MAAPLITPISYTYQKPNTEVWVLNMDDVPVEKSKILDQQFIHFGPKSIGGNHKHPRTEWFIAQGAFSFIWMDETGERHEEQMNPDGKLLLFEVPPFLPHAVVNTSNDKPGVLWELADQKMADVERVMVYEISS